LQSSGVSPGAINLTLIFLRGIASAAADLGLLSQAAAGELKLVRGVSAQATRAAPGRVCTPHEVAAIFAVCWQDHAIGGIRDLALLHGIYRAGLSTAELARLQLDDYTPRPPVLRIAPARSARRRQVELADETADVFRRWRATRGSRPGALFVRLGRGGRQTGQGMSASAITNVVRQRAKHAGLPSLTPQDLRRTAIHELIDSGVSPAEVHHRFGFVSHVTLASRYDHRDFTDARWQAWLGMNLPELSVNCPPSGS
jgi:integrase